MTNEKLQAVKQFLNLSEEEAENLQVSSYDENIIEYYSEEYEVLTDDEADEEAKNSIENSLWAFNADFIIRHCKNYDEMDSYEYNAAIESLKEAQANQCENLNGLVFALIDNISEFIADAICEDGRGHFVSYYDGCENEEEVNGTWYYIYRQN